MVKWLERLTVEWNIDGSSRADGPKVGFSLTVHPATNGYPVVTLGKLKVARKGSGHPTSLCRRPRISVPSSRHSPNVLCTELHMGLTFTFAFYTWMLFYVHVYIYLNFLCRRRLGKITTRESQPKGTIHSRAKEGNINFVCVAMFCIPLLLDCLWHLLCQVSKQH